MPRVNILKQVKGMDSGGLSRSLATGTDARIGSRCPTEGRCFIEWRERGKRRREAAGITAADALEAARRPPPRA